MIKQSMMKFGVEIYRRLPVGRTVRRRVRAALLGPVFAGSKPTIADWRGLRIWIDKTQALDLQLYFTGDYEPDTMAAVAELARPGTVVVDVGANIGMVSLWAAKCVGPAGRVIGIDPSAWACERARRNAELSNISNAEFVHAAVSDTIGEADLQIINGYRVDDVDTSAVEHVAVVTVDQLLEERGISAISMLKVDTDGYEVGVFRGAHHTLTAIRPDLVFELGPDHLRKTGNTVEALIGLLRGYGYTFFDEALQPVDPFEVAGKLAQYETANLVGRHPDAIAPATPAASGT